MFASLRGLIALAALALVALVVAILDRGAAPGDRAVVPGLDPEAIIELDGPGFALVKQGPAFVWREPVGAVEPGTLDRLMTALRGGRWHRRGGEAGASRGELVVKTAHDRHAIQLGQPLAGAEQTWLVVDGEAELVDGWVAAALFPAPLELRLRHPFEAIEAATSIEVTAEGLHAMFDGTPALANVQLAPGVELRLAPPISARIAAALAAVEVVAMPPVAPAPAATGLSIVALGPHATAVAAGTCAPDLVLLATSTGAGCVPAAAWAEVVASIDALRAPPAEIVERRPAPGARAITLADGTRIDLVKVPAGFDPVRVAALAAALATPADIATGDAKPVGNLVVDGQPIAHFADGSIARALEPVRLRLGRAENALLGAAGESFRDPRLWDEEPTTIAAIEIDGKTYARGATIGEWTGATDGKALEALAALLAAPVSVGPAAAFADRAHVVAIAIRRPDGGELRHELALSAGCRGMIGTRAVQLAAALCERVARAR